MLVAPLVRADLESGVLKFINKEEVELFKQYFNTAKDREYNK